MSARPRGGSCVREIRRQRAAAQMPAQHAGTAQVGGVRSPCLSTRMRTSGTYARVPAGIKCGMKGTSPSLRATASSRLLGRIPAQPDAVRSLLSDGNRMNIFAPLIRRPVGTSLLGHRPGAGGTVGLHAAGRGGVAVAGIPRRFMSRRACPGASAQTMANTVLAPLERHLGRIPGIDDMYGNASEGSAADPACASTSSRTADSAARDVQAAINAAAADLPSGMPSPPQYFKFDTSQIPILLVTLTSTGMPPDKLFDLADTLLKPAVAQIDGVAQVQVFGGTPHAVRIELDNQRAGGQGAHRQRRRQRTARRQRHLAAGHPEQRPHPDDGDRQRWPARAGRVRQAADRRAQRRAGAPVRRGQGLPAASRISTRRPGSTASRTVAMQISKRPEANAVATVEAIRARLPQLRGLAAGGRADHADLRPHPDHQVGAARGEGRAADQRS